MTKREVVVITGATAGVGRATVRQFAEQGADIALLARGRDGLDATAREVEAAGCRALPIQMDVANAAQMFDAAAEIERELGPIDIWVNNAMTTVFGRFVEMSPKEFARVTDVTYHGMVYGTMAALRVMVPRNRGTIVQVGSALAYRAIPLQTAYCGAKHACRGFTDGIRSELIHDGVDIHLTMVQLPALNTPQFRWCKSYMPEKAQPVPPIFQPEVAARAIHWAAHHRRREVHVGAPTLKTIWGAKAIPGLLDRYLAHKAFEGQMTGESEEERPSNLFEPVPGDHGAHGPFDDRAESSYALTAISKRAGAGGMRTGAALLGVGLMSMAAIGLDRVLGPRQSSAGSHAQR